MKKELAAFEIGHIVREFQSLAGARVDGIYHPLRHELLLQFHQQSVGKVIMRVALPGFIYVTTYRQEQPAQPSGFCTLLRKYLGTARLTAVRQLESERIIEFTFSAAQSTYSLFVELFSKGQIVLADEKLTIIAVLENQVWKDRTLKPKETYTYPKKSVNFWTLGAAELSSTLASSKKNIVKSLAVDIGLGGVYAEEICLSSHIDKSSNSLPGQEHERVYAALDNLRNRPLEPAIISDSAGNIDAVPVTLEFYKDRERTPAKTYSEALDGIHAGTVIEGEIGEKLAGKGRHIEKLRTIIEQQEQHAALLVQEIERDTQAAEHIYLRYTVLTELMETLRKAAKTSSLQELKRTLKPHPILKEIMPEKKQVKVEI